MDQPLTNSQGLTVQQMSQAAANPQQFNLNPPVVQPAQNQMQAQTIQQAQANPGVIAVGRQTGTTPAGQLPVQPVVFQAYANPQGQMPVQQPQQFPQGVQTQPVQVQAQPQGINQPQPSSEQVVGQNQAPQDAYTQQLDSLNKQTDDAYTSYKQSMDQLMQGTIPLSSVEQAQLQSIQARFDQMAAAQKDANSRYERGVTQAGISSGRARYAPEIQMGLLKSAIDSGIAKVANIEDQAMGAMADYRKGVEDKNYKMINESYEKLTGFLEKKKDTIASIQKAVLDHEEKMAELNQKAEQDQVMNTLKFAEFDQKAKQAAFDQAMASDKFDWSQKQDAVKNLMDSDKFSWAQKQDMIKNALDEHKFSYQQQKDLRDYQLDIKKLESADTPASYKEWKLAGQPGAYADFLKKKADAKPTTVDERKSAGFATRVKSSMDTIGILQKQLFSGKGGVGSWFSEISKTGGGVPSSMKSPEAQRLAQAELDFVNAVLRPESGAAISTSEFTSAEKQYFPQPGEDQATLDQKARARRMKLDNLVLQAGPALDEGFVNNLDKINYQTIEDFAMDNPNDPKLKQVPTMLQDKIPKNEILDFLMGNIEGSQPTFNNESQTSLKGQGKDLDKLASAIGQYESGGNYKARGPVIPSGSYQGQRALGKYQIMPGNLPSWSKQALGRVVSEQEFLNNPEIQDAIAKDQMSKHLDKYGRPEDVAAIWLSGRPLSGNQSKDLATGVTVPQYVKNVMKYYV